MKSLKGEIGYDPKYRIDCASSDIAPTCKMVFCDNPKSVKRVAGQLRRYYTSVVIKTYIGRDFMTGIPEYSYDPNSY
jgi:hypothetical protein